MTVDELMATLQKLSAEGHGAKPVLVYDFYSCCESNNDLVVASEVEAVLKDWRVDEPSVTIR